MTENTPSQTTEKLGYWIRNGPDEDNRSLLETAVGILLYWRTWVAGWGYLASMMGAFTLIEALGTAAAPIVMVLGIVVDRFWRWHEQ
ncbi:hypothetical protein C437_15356 [Haloarcula vallismortis ATCC 29715]|uniref:Uncharacterized protein n=1 Tax=Haloarcula vallismortis ATCC 29715 TaxID=662477 RepID=M0J1A1_HALVA|nr:hypothetical protein [Haloarcula vallismortis]EMA01809.1 hypothetical protein C437_15356 [Haloarcula vallismortis ATCC 29715]